MELLLEVLIELKKFAKLLLRIQEEKIRVIVVSSAMSGVTNDLVNKSKLISNNLIKQNMTY